MKKYILLFFVLLLVLSGVYAYGVIKPDKISIRTDICSDVESFDFNVILDEIFIEAGEKYNCDNSYLIGHWADMYNFDITSNKVIKDITISLAVEKKDMSYDIFQIRKLEGNTLQIKQVDKRDTFEELKWPMKAKVVFENLNEINWSNVIEIMPNGEFYTLRSWGIYRKGENFEVDSGVYHSLSPKIGYTIRKGVIEKFNTQIRQFSEDTIVSVIVPMNKGEEGYQGKANIALFIEMVDEF